MTPSTRLLLMLAVLAVMVPAAAYGHFKLLEPASWLVESDRGDPQQAAPCGGDTRDKGAPTNVIGKAVGGSTLHLKILETIYHPGHFRVALAVNTRDELPQTAPTPLQSPVIADGLFPHDTRPSQSQTYETDVRLPNITCAKCTLQVSQFVAQGPQAGTYSYHHCADLQITADPAKPIDEGWPAGR